MSASEAKTKASEITVGIDIGTSSVKALAADADGNVVARSRIPHDFYVPSPLRFEHDARVAWSAADRYGPPSGMRLPPGQGPCGWVICQMTLFAWSPGTITGP